MFEQVLAFVKEHIGNDPQMAAAIPGEHAEAIHQEIATHIHDNLPSQGTVPDGTGTAMAGTTVGGILSSIENSLASGGLATSVAAGGLVGALGSKFGLSSAVSGAIAAAVPGLLEKFVHKTNTPTV